MGVVSNIQFRKKEIENIVNIKDDKLYFILKFFQLEISEMIDINLTKQEQVGVLSKVLDREISYKSYISFYEKYMEGKKRIRKKIEAVRDEIYENQVDKKREYNENWVTEEKKKTGKTESEIYESL